MGKLCFDGMSGLVLLRSPTCDLAISLIHIANMIKIIKVPMYSQQE